ncbi:M3 family oligoendopeptidase [Paenibacillus cremeus]|uniref:M3 family oligoendopeptidase n=1 Tax=Paenibacillus cremeus TaxID=2163881 RepID=A0A559K8N8_9BACL|nr:M3 family oligoendopeptidase [Paenibacillus cremeus]TVY08496.1 M3 family oligoendopeptidase [Paenibacillus cremeus]
MRFEQFEYVRPDMLRLQAEMEELLQAFTQADSPDEQEGVLSELNRLRSVFESMAAIARIRHTVDTTDSFYKAEQDFFDQNTPVYQGLISRYYEALMTSPFRAVLGEKWGKQLFRIAELTVKTISPEVMDELRLENKLASDYVKLTASAKIAFDGAELNLAQLTPHTLSTDRATRKRAEDAKYAFFAQHEAKLDEIYDQLVKVRTSIAHKLGYSNFVELGYARMKRSDYDAAKVAVFREQVRTHLVPLASRIRRQQTLLLGVEQLTYYDAKYRFPSGNPTPKGDANWIIANGKRMYAELSPETDAFFRMMTEQGLMDLVSKAGKAVGGYCSYIKTHNAPFIFSNFNGTYGDIDVLTHEAGHAFQKYMSRHHVVPEYLHPTLEACEIHSMSMEFIAWPWMELFFQEETEKYKYAHLSDAILFIPYGTAVDEFQHFVYEHPEATPNERKAKWRELERIYRPDLALEENDLLNRGGYWFQQRHIFRTPFYYIDYTLAQICALQFWVRSRTDAGQAWEDYLRLCKEGGSKSFTELVEVARLSSPFTEGTIAPLMAVIGEWLEQADISRY